MSRGLMFGVGESGARGRVRARDPPWTASRWNGAAGRGGLPLVLFGLLVLHDRAALLRALLLGLRLHPALALAFVLAGTGMAAIGGGALAVALARVDSGALHGLAGVLLALGGELVTAREHADDCRRNDKAQSFLTVHPAVLLSWLRTHPSDHHGPTEGSGVYTTPGHLTNPSVRPAFWPAPRLIHWMSGAVEGFRGLGASNRRCYPIGSSDAA